MLKKGIIYLLFCSLLNIVTALPAKCCERGKAVHVLGNKTHSFTVLDLLLEDVFGIQDESNNGPDFHTSVFTVAHKTVVQQNIKHLQPGTQVATAPVAAFINYTGNITKQFFLPPHYNYLFRLTPF